MLPLSSMIFDDTNFPADESSIDGRARKQQNTYNNGSNTMIHVCKCNISPKLRQVYKEGKNQGRYFYGCALKSCSYFVWDDGTFESSSSSSSSSSYIWKRFTSEDGYVMVGKNGFSPEHVRQGGIGDCWFLSALAVIAERSDLIEHIVITRPHLRLDNKSEFRLFVDGDWQIIEVDNQLPCKTKKTRGQKRKLGVEEEEVLSFAKAFNSMLWVPLLEKAYAKIHGSYASVSGGYIKEALLDLTGAPCEAIDFTARGFDSEFTWAKLLSFHSVGYPMGCATSVSGEGVVGCHAYSILDVKEISDVSLGVQSSIRDFFKGEVELVARNGHSISSSKLESCLKLNKNELLSAQQTLRVLRIRNPWGRREWTGALSGSSELWTKQLESIMTKGTTNDGTFWITYHDFLRRFDSIDVCKAGRPGTQFPYSLKDEFLSAKISTGLSTHPNAFALLRSGCSFRITVTEPSYVFMSLLQANKRGKYRSALDLRYWYAAGSFILLREDDLMTRMESSSTITSSNHTTLRNNSGSIIYASLNGPVRDSVPVALPLAVGTYRLICWRHHLVTTPPKILRTIDHTSSGSSGTSSSTKNGGTFEVVDPYTLTIVDLHPFTMRLVSSHPLTVASDNNANVLYGPEIHLRSLVTQFLCNSNDQTHKYEMIQHRILSYQLTKNTTISQCDRITDDSSHAESKSTMIVAASTSAVVDLTEDEDDIDDKVINIQKTPSLTPSYNLTIVPTETISLHLVSQGHGIDFLVVRSTSLKYIRCGLHIQLRNFMIAAGNPYLKQFRTQMIPTVTSETTTIPIVSAEEATIARIIENEHKNGVIDLSNDIDENNTNWNNNNHNNEQIPINPKTSVISKPAYIEHYMEVIINPMSSCVVAIIAEQQLGHQGVPVASSILHYEHDGSVISVASFIIKECIQDEKKSVDTSSLYCPILNVP